MSIGSAKFGRESAQVGQTWPMSVDFASTPATCGSRCGRPMFRIHFENALRSSCVGDFESCFKRFPSVCFCSVLGCVHPTLGATVKSAQEGRRRRPSRRLDRSPPELPPQSARQLSWSSLHTPANQFRPNLGPKLVNLGRCRSTSPRCLPHWSNVVGHCARITSRVLLGVSARGGGGI